jgi:hypothetical protein
MYVPQALFPYTSLRVGVEGMQICHELIFIEEMDKLCAMKLHSIDQEDGVVDTGDNERIGVRKATCAIPEKFIC